MRFLSRFFHLPLGILCAALLSGVLLSGCVPLDALEANATTPFTAFESLPQPKSPLYMALSRQHLQLMATSLPAWMRQSTAQLETLSPLQPYVLLSVSHNQPLLSLAFQLPVAKKQWQQWQQTQGLHPSDACPNCLSHNGWLLRPQEDLFHNVSGVFVGLTPAALTPTASEAAWQPLPASLAQSPLQQAALPQPTSWIAADVAAFSNRAQHQPWWKRLKLPFLSNAAQECPFWMQALALTPNPTGKGLRFQSVGMQDLTPLASWSSSLKLSREQQSHLLEVLSPPSGEVMEPLSSSLQGVSFWQLNRWMQWGYQQGLSESQRQQLLLVKPILSLLQLDLESNLMGLFSGQTLLLMEAPKANSQKIGRPKALLLENTSEKQATLAALTSALSGQSFMVNMATQNRFKTKPLLTALAPSPAGFKRWQLAVGCPGKAGSKAVLAYDAHAIQLGCEADAVSVPLYKRVANASVQTPLWQSLTTVQPFFRGNQVHWQATQQVGLPTFQLENATLQAGVDMQKNALFASFEGTVETP